MDRSLECAKYNSAKKGGGGMVKVYMRGSGANPVIEGFSKELAGIW
jgi:hypothetical protein